MGTPKHFSPIGRPTKYRADMPDRAYQLMAQGKSKTVVLVDLGITPETFSDWRNPNSPRYKRLFSEAIKLGEKAQRAWWENLVQDVCSGANPDGNLGTGFVMYARNSLNWRTRDPEELEQAANLAALVITRNEQKK